MGNVSNIRIKPMNVILGQDTPQVEQITCIADIAGASAGKYFLFHTVAGLKKYIWLKVGASVDPAPAGGWVGTPAIVVAGDSANTIATTVAAAMVTAGGVAAASGAVVTRTHATPGYCPPARDSDVAPTGFAFAVTVKGDLETDVGFTDGDIELSGLSTTLEVITAHQTGKTELGNIITGYNKPELGFTLKETSKAKIQSYLVAQGSTTYVPEGSGKVEVLGYGAENIGSSLPTKRLRLHPVSKDSSDKSEDFVFWNTALTIEKFNFSGEKFSVVPVKLPVYPDFTKKKSAQYFIIGDPTNI